MRIIWIIGLVFVTFALSGCDVPQIAKLNSKALPDEPISQINEIEIGPNGVNPQLIAISAGQTVSFKNLDKTPHTIASDPHPTHDQLNNLYSTPIFRNQTYKYTFTKRGEFGFHLEDNPSISGKIVVK